MQEKAKAIALGLDAVPDIPVNEDLSTTEMAKEVPMDTETHLSVETTTIKVLFDQIEVAQNISPCYRDCNITVAKWV